MGADHRGGALARVGFAAAQPDPDSVAAYTGGARLDERATSFRLKAIERGYLWLLDSAMAHRWVVVLARGSSR